MKILSSKAHGILDYLLVIILFAAPMLFKLEGFAATLAYALGCAHLLITIITDFELGLIKKLLFSIHGIIELLVSIVLAGVTFYFYKEDGEGIAYKFYAGLTLLILVVFFITDYNSAPANK